MAMPLAAPASTRSLWTVRALERLPDEGGRYEVLHDELLIAPLPAVRHQRVAARLGGAVCAWCGAPTMHIAPAELSGTP